MNINEELKKKRFTKADLRELDHNKSMTDEFWPYRKRKLSIIELQQMIDAIPDEYDFGNITRGKAYQFQYLVWGADVDLWDKIERGHGVQYFWDYVEEAAHEAHS